MDLCWEGPKVSGGGREVCANGTKDLCWQAELKPGSDAQGQHWSLSPESHSHLQQQQGPELLEQ